MMQENQNGAVMLVVISIVLMLVILSAAVLMISSGHFGTSYDQIKRAQAYYAAEAAIQHALFNCRTGGYDLDGIPSNSNPGVDPDTPQRFPPHTITDRNYTLTADIQIYAINEGGAPRGTHRIDVTVEY